MRKEREKTSVPFPSSLPLPPSEGRKRSERVERTTDGWIDGDRGGVIRHHNIAGPEEEERETATAREDLFIRKVNLVN